MKFAQKSLLVFICGILAVPLMIFSLSGTAAAAAGVCGQGGVTCPYLKAYGGDVMAGGWFNSATGSCNTSDYQSWDSGSPASIDNGGILTYTKSPGGNAGGGSSSQYAAFATGAIEGNSSLLQGFYSDGAAIGGPVSKLSFANTGFPNGGGSPWGGEMEGSTSQLNCIPDYFDTKQDNPVTVTPDSTNSVDVADLNNAASKQYYVDDSASAAPLNLGGYMANGQNTTLFVKGNVYIPAGVIYNGGYTALTVPKFALVVRGNIYIGSGVTEIDGLYIAQPNVGSTATTNDGYIWTCYTGGSLSSPDGNSMTTGHACNADKLCIEGAMIAKDVYFLRTKGDVSTTSSTADDTFAGGLYSGNNSDFVNYSPTMVVNGGFFNASSSAAIDSMVSLPPVY